MTQDTNEIINPTIGRRTLAEIRIDGYLCSEAEANAIQEALSLLTALGQGQLTEIGHHFKAGFTSRKDITASFRERVAAVASYFDQAQVVLHKSNDPKAHFKLDNILVPAVAIRAFQLLCRATRDEQALSFFEGQLRKVAEQTKME